MRTGIISKYHVFLPAKRLENIRFCNKIEDKFLIQVSHFKSRQRTKTEDSGIFILQKFR
jgi:hypothetical protein